MAGSRLFCERGAYTKGGIHEGANGFEVMHKHFWLFPTGFHQNREKVAPELVETLEPDNDGKVHLRYTARVEIIRKLEDFGQVKRLQPFHFWQPPVIEERFYQGKFEGLYLLLLRVFAAPETVVIDYLPEYGGCRSWVDLPLPLPSENLQPVLSDENIEGLKQTVFNSLGL